MSLRPIQIVINEANVTTGIKLLRFGQSLNLKVRKEVILSAGYVGSPQILMLSGVGSKDHLYDLNIPVKCDLPGVGQNLQDHLYALFGIHSNTSERIKSNPFDNLNPLNYVKYLVWGHGSLVRTDLGGFLHSGVSKDPLNSPDVQIIFLAATMTLDYGLKFRKATNVADEYYFGTFEEYQDR